jgi:hypothetical protein
MPIDFTLERWEETKETHRLWWRGELDRPLVYAGLYEGRDPGVPVPDYPLLTNQNCSDFSLALGPLLDRLEYELSRQVFPGDSYPSINLNLFGPGMCSAFLGAEVECAPTTIWFHPPEEREIKDIHFEYNPDNPWLNRIKDLCAAAMEKWQGLVQLSMPDLGGTLDILSVFRPSEKLLLDLYDHPDEVQRLRWECHECWHRFYDEITDVLQPTNPGHTSWDGLFSNESYYILQCDFAYMISPEMFDEFVLEDLADSCKRLGASFYHLDGDGQLAHVKSLLGIDELDGIQWVPSSHRPHVEWADFYCELLDAGKKLHMRANLEVIEAMEKGFGSVNNCMFWGWAHHELRDDTVALLDRYDLPRG